MKATVGDRIVIASNRLDGPVRDGEIVGIRNLDGTPPYLVEWSDTGEQVFFFQDRTHTCATSRGQPRWPIPPLATTRAAGSQLERRPGRPSTREVMAGRPGPVRGR